jgi:transcriptional regulator with XRE-family HTH domain
MQMLDEDAFNAAFQERLRRIRTDMGWSQPRMAAALGLGLDAYKKYEKRPRSAFPLFLLPKLVLITDTTYAYWFGVQADRSNVRLFRPR